MPSRSLRPEADTQNLPAVQDAGEIEPDVLEGEIVDEEGNDLAPSVSIVQVIHHVVHHDSTKFASRHLMYIPLGFMVMCRRLWDSRTTSRYERYIRSAESAGDHESALAWDERMQRFRKERHERRVDMIRIPVELALAIPKILLGLLLVLGITGTFLAIASGHISDVATPFRVVAQCVFWAAIAVSVSWGPVVLALPWIGVGALWWTGKAHANANLTGWLAPNKDDSELGLIITADTIVLALQNLDKIPALKKAFKDSWRPTFHTQPVREGQGYAAVFSIPLGVTAEMIADQRPVLARNVHRAEVEVWPSDAEKTGIGPPGTVAIWIADSGAISKAAPEYPLMHEGTADVFSGVPGGVSPRGDQIMIPVVGANFVCGGQMGQGKSNACRVIIAGVALDPLAEIDVFVFAMNGDFDVYQPRLRMYRKGVDDDVILAALARLWELYAEVERREARLAELGAKKLTRQIAQDHPDLRPIVALFSECHELFGHKEFGEEAGEVATKTAKRARKTGITLGFDTQSSRKEAIPPKLVELVAVNVCFYVKTWRSNDGFLGDGSFAAGIRATELRFNRDRGTAVVTGVSDGQFELLRWYFIEVDDDTGYDAAADIIARSMSVLAPGTSIGGNAPVREIERRDLLGDLDEVLEDERVRIADLPALLRDLAPDWGPYRNLTGVQLRDLLEDADVRWTNVGNVPRLDPEDLRQVIRERGVS